MLIGITFGSDIVCLAQDSCVANISVHELEAYSFPIELQCTPNGDRLLVLLKDRNRLQIHPLRGSDPILDVGTGEGPISLAISWDGSTAFTVNQGSQNVSVIRIEDGNLLAQVPLPYPLPYRILPSQDGTQMVIAMQGSGPQSYFSFLDLATLQLSSSFVSSGHGITAVSFYDPNQPATGRVGYHYTQWQTKNDRIYIPDFSRYRGFGGAADYGLVRVYDFAGTSLANVPVSPYPAALKISSDGSRAIVVHNDVFFRKASVVDLRSHQLEREIDLGEALPVNRTLVLHPDNERAYVSTTAGLLEIRLSTGQFRLIGGGRATALEMSSDGRWVCGTGYYGFLFDVSTDRFIPIPFGAGFSSLVFLPNSPILYTLWNQFSHFDNGFARVDFSAQLRDINGDSRTDSADFFVFVSRFIAGGADLNGDGNTTSQDFFRFLEIFFACR